MVKGLTAKAKKHISTVGYYAGKQQEELVKVQNFLVEEKINDDISINVALVGVKSGEVAADVAIEQIDAVLSAAYAEQKAKEKVIKDAEKAKAKAEKEASIPVPTQATAQ